MESGSESTSRSPSERRRYHRMDVQLPVTPLLGDFLSGRTGFSTVTLDLSQGGAKIRVPEELPLASVLGLDLHFPDGTVHTYQARVLRSSRYPDEAGETGAWAALEFVDLPDEARHAIADLLAREADDQP